MIGRIRAVVERAQKPGTVDSERKGWPREVGQRPGDGAASSKAATSGSTAIICGGPASERGGGGPAAEAAMRKGVKHKQAPTPLERGGGEKQEDYGIEKMITLSNG